MYALTLQALKSVVAHRARGLRFRKAVAGLMALIIICHTTMTSVAMAAGRTGSGPVALKKSAGRQSGETTIVYGPRRFDRTTGAPRTVIDNFSLPSNVGAPFLAQVQNGAPDGSGRVSSATIRLNGADLFTPRDFNQNVASLERPVNLLTANTLEVRLASAPGSFIIITFTASITRLESISPPQATQGQTLGVTLRGRNTRWSAGQTRASFGPEVSVGGAAPGEVGPVQVIDATTAVAQVTVQPAAALDLRNVRVETPLQGGTKEVVALNDAFKVTALSPPGNALSLVETIAGLAGSPGLVDGAASQARFRDLTGIAVGPDDSIYVADSGNNCIRVIREEANSSGGPALIVSTLAGDGTAGFVDGPGASARFNNPQGVAVDSSGAVYVADTKNNRVRRIATDGTVTTLAGDGTAGFRNGAGNQAQFNAPRGVAVDSRGNIYVADSGNSAVRFLSSGGDVSTVAGDGSTGSNDSPDARFDGVAGVAVDGDTLFVYLADTGNHRIRRLDLRNQVITLAGADRGFADGSANEARFAGPSAIAIDGSGNLVVADAVNSLIREVDPALAEAGSAQAVTTLAGTGERGSINGAGSVARFQTPGGVAVTASSAIMIADSGNHTLRRILVPPRITSINPARGRVLEEIAIDGQRFDGRSPDRNVVRFTRSAQAGGGETAAQVLTASRTRLTVVVPADASTGPVTVQTQGGTAMSPANFEITAPVPVITDFNPRSGPVGTLVTITGALLKADGGSTAVTFAGSNNTRLPALVSFASSAEVRAAVPNGAVTGLIELSNAFGRAVSNEAFTVTPSDQQDFQLTVSPPSTSAVEGGTATYVVTVTGSGPAFTQLAQLSVSGAPSGVGVTFEPDHLTGGASSTLSVGLASASLAPGSYSFAVRAAALVDGSERVRSQEVTLNILAAGQTTLSGRVLSTEKEPIIGAAVSLDGKTATTDAAGAFLLSGVSAGADRPVMVDGRTASAPNRTYPVIIEPATVVAGQANVVPFTFYLPPIDTQFEVDVVPGRDTEAGNANVPGLKMTIPAGANLRNRDGSPVARVSITPLAIDRTPAPLPSDVATNLVYTSQPGGAQSDLAMPVSYPNLSGASPGTRAPLYAFDHDTVQWYIYGYGRVSGNAETIEPEIDPSTGRPYGLRDFSWHFPNVSPEGDPGDPDECPSNRGGSPVDYSTGMKIENATDISFGGARGGLELARVYTTDLAQSCDNCPFGRGTNHNYSYRLSRSAVSCNSLRASNVASLNNSSQVGGIIAPPCFETVYRVATPEQVTGRLFRYSGRTEGSTLIFTTRWTASQSGDELRVTGNTAEYRKANGDVMRFDSNGKLIALADRNGNTTTLTYTGSNLTRVTDSVARSITLDYDTAGRIVRATDPIGRAWRYTYESGPLTTVTDPLGNITRYEYAIGARLISITDPRGNKIKQISYDGAGRVREQRFADGGIERYAYTMSGAVVTGVTITDPLGHTMSKRLNARGYVIEEIDQLGQASKIERAMPTNFALKTSGPCGCVEATRSFDLRGNVVALTDRLGQTETYEYHPTFDKPTRISDKLGRVTTYVYDSRGNLTSATNALNQTTAYEYDQFGQLTAITNPLGHVMRFEYDGNGNASAMIDALGNRTTMEYDAIGRPIAIVDPLSRRASKTYDALGRVLTSTDSAGATTRLSYDANGNLTRITNALGNHWTASYDAKNRVISKSDPAGQATQLEYDAANNVIAKVSPAGRTSRYSYDARDQLTTMTEPLGSIVRLSYDNRGNLTTLTDQRGNTTVYSYDELYRPTSMRDPLGRAAVSSYDAVGNVTSVVDRMGRRTNVAYDPLNRPSRVDYADASVSYTYDAARRLIRIDDTQSGSIRWAYDDADRLLSETTQAGAVRYSYNAANQRASMTAADRPQVDYGYDTAGRVQTISQGTETFSYSYDLLSRRASLQRPNGVTTTYTYDSVNRLTQLKHVNGQNQVLEDFRYVFNADDEITSITSLFSEQQLPTARTIGPANAANRIAQFGEASFDFDNQGQRTINTDAQGTTTYEWDARGRMTRAILPDGQTVSYGYDVLGRRISRTSGGVTTSFLYDRQDIVLDRGTDGSIVDYLGGTDTDEILRQTSAGAALFYFIQDHLGSTTALTDADGNVAARMQYDAFGDTTASPLTKYGYTGREKDPTTGLLYYRARWYDARQGRFISEDPAGFTDGTNLYTYVSNNPINWIDPSGFGKDKRYNGDKSRLNDGPMPEKNKQEKNYDKKRKGGDTKSYEDKAKSKLKADRGTGPGIIDCLKGSKQADKQAMKDEAENEPEPEGNPFVGYPFGHKVAAAVGAATAFAAAVGAAAARAAAIGRAAAGAAAGLILIPKSILNHNSNPYKTEIN